MNTNSATRVVIRHLGGSKINRVEHFELRDLREITIGRDANSDISLDPQVDDMVSRNHAVIRVNQGDPPSFRIADLNSSNGTFLNGERIAGEVELLPDDIVELGPGGAKFAFDVDPRPAALASRTRVVSPIDTIATRVVAAAAAAPQTAEHTPSNVTASTAAVPVKAAVGKATVQRMLVEERRNTSRVWMSSVAAVAVVAILAGGWLYWQNLKEVKRLEEEAVLQSDKLRSDTSSNVAERLGKSAQDIVTKFGDATVYIEVQWRLYDQGTGRPIFQKTNPHKGELLPCYVKLPDGSVVRWLTLEDEARTNLKIGEDLSASGFVVNERGFILTNKHVAASWMMRYGIPSTTKALIYPLGWDGSRSKEKSEFVDLADRPLVKKSLEDWLPTDGGRIFEGKFPRLITFGGGENRTFNGRDDVLNVQFPGDKGAIRANLVRASDQDVALIKIDVVDPLRSVVDLATDDKVELGERVIVLGYPTISQETCEIHRVNDAGKVREKCDLIPKPTVTDGIISRLGAELKERGLQTYGDMGDAYQMSVVATGAGNSGGPVFNAKARAIAIFFRERTYKTARVTFAVPIKHGRELMGPPGPRP
jgi:serine protease Do